MGEGTFRKAYACQPIMGEGTFPKAYACQPIMGEGTFPKAYACQPIKGGRDNMEAPGGRFANRPYDILTQGE